MKKAVQIGVIIVLSIFSLGSSFFMVDLQYDKEKSLRILTREVLSNLYANSYSIFDKYNNKDYIVLDHPYLVDVYVRIYANSSLQAPNMIVIELPINSRWVIFDKNQYKLNGEILQFFQNSFNMLACSDNKDFMKSGFECMDQYTISYTVYEDRLNNLRNKIGIGANKQLYIQILPM